MEIGLPYWTIPLAMSVGGFAVMAFWPYAQGGDYSFNLMPIFAFFMWIIGSLAAWLIYFMVF